MRNPPGVTMWRNGACAITSCSAARSAASSDRAKPRSTTAPGPNCSCRDSTSPSSSNRSFVIQAPSRRIVEDDPQRVAMPRAYAAHAMAEIDPVHAARALHRTVMDGEYHRVALAQRHHFRSRLHARTLLGDHEFAAREVPPGLGQQDRHLEREDVLA